MAGNIKDYFTKITKEAYLGKNDPLADNIKAYLEENYNHNRCHLGRPELDHYCMLAYLDEDDNLLCGAMVNWTDNIQVEGLKQCFLLMKKENMLAETNRRKRGNLKGAKYEKVNRV